MQQNKIDQMVRDVSVRLCNMSDETLPRENLVFPRRRLGRDAEVRISEQESKILFAEWLTSERRVYSVETPTFLQYGRGGAGNMDMTVYDSHARLGRDLNIELKAHQPTPASCRNDMDKLLREEPEGLWFVTLESANKRTWEVLEEKLRDAFTDLNPSPPMDTKINFAFCAIRPRLLRRFSIDFNGDWGEQLGDGFRRDPEGI